jgi:hypothetical protein
MKTLRGIQGHALFVKWFDMQTRGKPSVEMFLKSKYFNAFHDFAKFIARVKMHSPESYMQIMIQKNFPPSMWCKDDTYAFYIDHVLYNMPARAQISRTVNFLTKMCEKTECDYRTLIDSMEATDILFFIRQGSISPWILMHSMKLKEIFQDPDHLDEYNTLKSLIRPAYWKFKFSRESDMVQFAKQTVNAMGI